MACKEKINFPILFSIISISASVMVGLAEDSFKVEIAMPGIGDVEEQVEE